MKVNSSFAVLFKLQTIDRSSGVEPYHIQLQENFTRRDRGSARESEVEITYLDALVQLVVKNKDNSGINS